MSACQEGWDEQEVEDDVEPRELAAGELVQWQNVVNLETVDSIAARTTGAGWDAGASSIQTIVGDGFVQFSTNENDRYKAAGLAHSDDHQVYTDIDFGFYLGGDGQFYVLENTALHGFGAYAPGDSFRVEVVDDQVRYRKNGLVIHTSAATPVYPLVVDVSLYNAVATLTGVVMANCEPGDTACMPAEVWKNMHYSTWSAGTLRRNTGAGWNAGASSVQELAGDGYVQFSTAEIDRHKAAGLNHGDEHQVYTDIDFGYYLAAGGQLYIAESGALVGFGAFEPGELLRVESVGGVVRYRRNGLVIHTSAAPPVHPMVLDASLYDAGASITAITIQDCLPGDAACMPPIPWKNVRYTTWDGSELRRNTGAGWDAGASSTQSIAGDGYVEFSTDEIDHHKAAGLNHGDAHQVYTDIDFGYYFAAGGQLYINESGALIGLGAYTPGEVLRVEVVDGLVRYRRGGALIHTSTTAPTHPMVLDTSFYDVGGSITSAVVQSCAPGDAACMPVEPWKNLRFVTWDGGTLRRNTGAGWDGGASSVQALEGDGYVEFSTAETDLYKAAGLGHGDANQVYTDIEFGFYLAGNGQFYVNESGGLTGHGAYAAGDVFRVEVVDGQVHYRRNGELLQTSAATPQFPLVLDTSLYQAGATLTDLSMPGGALSGGGDCPYLRVDNPSVNVRQSATTQSSEIGTLYKGAVVEIVDVVVGEKYNGADDQWYQIDLEGATGYVYSGVVECSQPPPEFHLPFHCSDLAGSIEVEQGNGGTYSHNVGTQSHYAFDFGVPLNTPVYPIAPGVVVVTSNTTQPPNSCYDGGGAGCKDAANRVTVRHADMTESIYAHLNDVYVAPGDQVTLATVLGVSGNTGWSSNAHLHVARQESCGDSSGWCDSMPLEFTDGVGAPDLGQSFCD